MQNVCRAHPITANGIRLLGSQTRCQFAGAERSPDRLWLCHRHEVLRREHPVHEGKLGGGQSAGGLHMIQLVPGVFSAAHRDGRLHVHRDAGGPTVVVPDGHLLHCGHHSRDAAGRVHAAGEAVRPVGAEKQTAEVSD